jgi:hypothetical protein
MASKNAVAEYLNAREKTAAPGWGESFRSAGSGLPGQFAHAATTGLATAAVGAGIAGLGLAASKIMDAASKGRDFRAMLEHNEDLRAAHTEDPKKINMLFSTVRTMNPEFSKDPLIAGSAVRKMFAYPNGIEGHAAELAGGRRNFQSPLLDTFLKGGLEGAKGGVGEGARANFMANQGDQQREKSDYEHQLRMQERMSEPPMVETTYEHDRDTGQERPSRRVVKQRGK